MSRYWPPFNSAKRILICLRYLLLVAILLPTSGLAAQHLQAYSASYSLYRNSDQRVAQTQFQLQPRNDIWVWSMQTSPTGIYRWLTRKQPFAETHLILRNDSWQPLLQVDGDYPDHSPKRAVWFDYDQQRFYYADQEHSYQRDFSAPIYTYHSVMLLYPQMKRDGIREKTITFYRKGQKQQTRLKLDRNVTIKRGKNNFRSDRLTQTYANGKRQMVYYFDHQPTAPLLIKQIKQDEHTLMWRDEIKYEPPATSLQAQ